MGQVSSIEWTGWTLNIWTGCEWCSVGCDNCYAKTLIDQRLSKAKGTVFFGRKFEDVQVHEERFLLPIRSRTPAPCFVNSLSDMWHRDITDWDIDRAMAVLVGTPIRVYQILTKRAERMERYMRGLTKERLLAAAEWFPQRVTPEGEWLHTAGKRPGYRDRIISAIKASAWPAPHIWLCVSVEDEKSTWRIPHLLRTPAAERGLSMEPLLEDVDISRWLAPKEGPGVSWVIVGGESGRNARPFDADWARAARDRCVAAGVPYFFKQHGGVQKKKTGRVLDGRVWSEMPSPRLTVGSASGTMIA